MSATRRTPWRPEVSGTAGFTLVELLVTMVLLGIVGGVVTSAVVAVSRAARVGDSRVATTAELQRVMARAAREIRSADPLRPLADPRQRLRATVERDGDRLVLEYALVGDEFRETRTTYPGGGATASGTTTRALMKGIESSPAVFSYLASDGTVVANPVAQPNRVFRVQLSLASRTATGDLLQVETDIQVRNATGDQP